MIQPPRRIAVVQSDGGKWSAADQREQRFLPFVVFDLTLVERKVVKTNWETNEAITQLWRVDAQ